MSDSKAQASMEQPSPYGPAPSSAAGPVGQPAPPGYAASVHPMAPDYGTLPQSGPPPYASSYQPPPQPGFEAGPYDQSAYQYQVAAAGAPQMKYAYPAPQATGQQVAVVHTVQPMAVCAIALFGESPVNMTCPHCHNNIITSTHYDTGGLTWLLCGILAILGCWLGCCFIPFCVDGCKDCIHTCPSCHVELGRYKRL